MVIFTHNYIDIEHNYKCTFVSNNRFTQEKWLTQMHTSQEPFFTFQASVKYKQVATIESSQDLITLSMFAKLAIE